MFRLPRWIASLFAAPFRHAHVPRGPGPARTRPQLESLSDRVLLSAGLWNAAGVMSAPPDGSPYAVSRTVPSSGGEDANSVSYLYPSDSVVRGRADPIQRSPVVWHDAEGDVGAGDPAPLGRMAPRDEDNRAGVRPPLLARSADKIDAAGAQAGRHSDEGNASPPDAAQAAAEGRASRSGRRRTAAGEADPTAAGVAECSHIVDGLSGGDGGAGADQANDAAGLVEVDVLDPATDELAPSAAGGDLLDARWQLVSLAKTDHVLAPAYFVGEPAAAHSPSTPPADVGPDPTLESVVVGLDAATSGGRLPAAAATADRLHSDAAGFGGSDVCGVAPALQTDDTAPPDGAQTQDAFALFSLDAARLMGCWEGLVSGLTKPFDDVWAAPATLMEALLIFGVWRLARPAEPPFSRPAD